MSISIPLFPAPFSTNRGMIRQATVGEDEIQGLEMERQEKRDAPLPVHSTDYQVWESWNGCILRKE